ATISSIVVDRATAGSTTSSTIFVATNFGVYKSINSGATWDRRLYGTNGTLEFYDLVQDPSNSQALYVGVRFNGIWKTINGGTNWSQLSGGELPTSGVGRVAVAISASSPSTLYAAVEKGGTNGPLGLFQSTN